MNPKKRKKAGNTSKAKRRARKSAEAPLLSLCMIVRDSARTLGACLESIRPWVDEMIVVDTGSQDNTREIAKEYDARLFEFPWCDDFSAARNESLAHAQGQWLFWMDSDDTIDAKNGRKLRNLVEGPHEADVLGYVVKVRCPGSNVNGVAGFTAVDHVKLIRNHPDLRFEFRIHEQILPAVRRLGGRVVWSDTYVVHSGSDTSREGKKKKCDRDLRILAKELEDRPDHPFALFNLGMTYGEMQRHEEAVEALTRSLERSDPFDSQVRKTYALLVTNYQRLKEWDKAWETCAEGLRHYETDSELLFHRGNLAHRRGDLAEAERAFLRAVRQEDDGHFSSIDPGVVGYKARHKLALVYQDMKRNDLAEVQWWRIVDEEPQFRPARRALGQMLIDQGRFVTAAVHAETMDTHEALRCEAGVLRAAMAEARSDFRSARRELEAAVSEYPDEDEPLQALCRLLFEQFEPAVAIVALQDLVRRDPSDAAARRNLGLMYMQVSEYEMAANAYRESLRIRPDSPATWLEHADALEKLGKWDDAAMARNQAERVASQDEPLAGEGRA